MKIMKMEPLVENWTVEMMIGPSAEPALVRLEPVVKVLKRDKLCLDLAMFI